MRDLGESSYHLSLVPIWPRGEMPTKPGKNRRGPTAADASVGGKESEERKRKRERRRRKEERECQSLFSYLWKPYSQSMHIVSNLYFLLSSLHCHGNTKWIVGALMPVAGWAHLQTENHRRSEAERYLRLALLYNPLILNMRNPRLRERTLFVQINIQ